MGEDGCDRFQWAYEDLGKRAPWTPPSLPTSSQRCHNRRRSPSIELSPAFEHGWSASHRSPKKRRALPTTHHRTLSANISPSSRPLQHRMPSVELSESFEPLTYARHRNFAKKHMLPSMHNHIPSSVDSSRSTPAPCVDGPLHEGTSSNPRIWPFDFYADEMDIGFKKCRLESNKHRPVQKVFQDHFHVKFVRSTFYDHRRHWMSVSSFVRQRYIGFGHTERGRWSTFLRQEIRSERRLGQL